MSTHHLTTESFELTADVRPAVQESDYLSIHPYIDSIAAVAQLTYKSLYIIDYHRMNFLYVSNNPLFLCGKSVEEVQAEGYAFYLSHVPAEDLDFLYKINRAGFDFFSEIAIDERAQYTISYNFHIYAENERQKILINHQLTPLKLDTNGNIWLALCQVSMAPSQEIHTAYMTANASHRRWRYTLQTERWKECDRIDLTENEKAVIRLANQGFSVGEIAAEIHKSEDSVKGYRKNLFVKLGVTNISEAIAFAAHHKLI